VSLDVVAVEGFTRGRLNRDDDETQNQLDAALAAARNYCGWHVTPEIVDDTVTLDGTGTSVLVLPTLKVTDLTEVEEDGETLELTDLSWSERGLILKKSGYWWSALFRSITVTFSHGYNSAPDFESVIFSAIERGAFSSDSAPRVIGPFQYSDPGNADAVLFTDSERAVLDRYTLEKTP
jgi:hypothetical protein